MGQHAIRAPYIKGKPPTSIQGGKKRREHKDSGQTKVETPKRCVRACTATQRPASKGMVATEKVARRLLPGNGFCEGNRAKFHVKRKQEGFKAWKHRKTCANNYCQTAPKSPNPVFHVEQQRVELTAKKKRRPAAPPNKDECKETEKEDSGRTNEGRQREKSALTPLSCRMRCVWQQKVASELRPRVLPLQRPRTAKARRRIGRSIFTREVAAIPMRYIAFSRGRITHEKAYRCPKKRGDGNRLSRFT